MVSKPETFLGQKRHFLESHLAQFETQLENLLSREPDDEHDAIGIEIAVRQTKRVINELKNEIAQLGTRATTKDTLKVS